MKKRECDCPDFVIECAHADGMAAVLIHSAEPSLFGHHWGSAIVRGDILNGGQMNPASAAGGSELEMREHFAELSELMRKGTLRELMDFAANEGIQ